MNLAFGYRGMPEEVTTAWGARMIAHAEYLDLLPDRQVAEGPRKQELLDILHDRMPRQLLNDQAWKVRGDQDEEIVFYEDDEIVVKGSAQRSFGYLYIAAWFKDEEA